MLRENVNRKSKTITTTYLQRHHLLFLAGKSLFDCFHRMLEQLANFLKYVSVESKRESEDVIARSVK